MRKIFTSGIKTYIEKPLWMSVLLLIFVQCGKKENHLSLENKMPNEQVVAQWPNAVTYEIFVQSFADTNHDGIGDINGLTQKLDYLNALGIQAIWLMPIMPSPSYHKYDVTDYKAIHPDYGTMEDFKTFVKEAHKRNIHVIIDMIINHTSNEHPWFLASSSSPDNPYRDYYIWADDDQIEKVSSLEKEATGDSDNVTQWHNYPGNEEKYYGFFTGQMPDLNYDNPKVREEIINMCRFWLTDIGIDGFRLDAAKHIYEEYRVQDNHEWWQEFKAAMQETKPDVYLVGEVWDNAEFVAPFLKGLPALFNFDLAFSILESIKQEKSVTASIHEDAWKVDTTTSFESGYQNNQNIYKSVTTDYKDAIFLSNHDQTRILSALNGDIDKGKLAASILLTMPGTPYLYYGEELGMLGEKPDPNIREPFQWKSQQSDSMRCAWIKPEYTTDKNVTPLAEQEEQDQSILNHYKKLINLRNHSKALSMGEFKDFALSNPSLIAFTRKSAGEELLVIHNVSSSSVQISTNDTKGYSKVYFHTNQSDKIGQDDISLEPFSSIIIGK